MDDKSAFVSGKEAAKAGKPITSNPFSPQKNCPPDEYPCDFESWIAGWHLVIWTREHDAELTRNAAKNLRK